MHQTTLERIEQELKKIKRQLQCGTQFFDTVEEFPEVGVPCAIYVDKSSGAFYVYDTLTSTYITADAGEDVDFSLTTTGTSGPATLVGTILNIPQYQAALTNPVTGTGTAGQVSYWTGTNTQTGSQDFTWNDTTKILSFSNGGTLINEIRVGSINSNTIMGRAAGSSASLTGTNNSLFGSNAGRNNTTGTNNSFFGSSAGLNNLTGGNNSFFGREAGFSNTTGGNNSFFGSSAGRFIANGSNLTVANNSVFLGFDTRAAADNETNQTVIGYQAIGLGSNTTVIGNSSTTLTWLGGSTSIGTTTSSARLHVRGSGTTSSTTALLVQNSTPSELLKVTDDGVIRIGSNVNGPVIYTGGAGNPTLGSAQLVFGLNNFNSISSGSMCTFLTNVTSTTAGSSSSMLVVSSFSPVSGSHNHIFLTISSTINQTGGANGITRGLYVNPTLTAAADWRGVEISTGATNTVVLGKNTGSAAVEVTSTTQGFLPPRMTTAQRNLIATPSAGLVIFNTTTTKLECFDGAVWQAAW